MTEHCKNSLYQIFTGRKSDFSRRLIYQIFAKKMTEFRHFSVMTEKIYRYFI